jgi:hypothetical protein
MSESLVRLIANGLKILLMVLGIVYGFLIIFNGGYAKPLEPKDLAVPEGTIEENITAFQKIVDETKDEELKKENLEKIDYLKGTITLNNQVSVSLRITYWVLGIALSFAVLFAVVLLALHFKSNLGAMAGMAVFAVLCLISYSMASGDVPDYWALKDPNFFNAGSSFWTDAGLKLMYITGVLSVFAILGGFVWGVIKRFA